MKHQEAIDMILDGGEAYKIDGSERICKISFRWNENIQAHTLCVSRNGIWEDGFIMDKEDFTCKWIVEKDGVVYEEYQPFIGKKDLFKTFSEDVSCPYCHSKDLIKFDMKDTLPGYYTCTKCQWQGLFLEPTVSDEPIIVDEVNEDWLEKKILCLMRKQASKVITVKEVMGTCFNAECPFCFPGLKVVGKTRPYFSPKEAAKEEPREKVTVNEVLDHIAHFYTYLHSGAIYSMRNLDPLALVQITQPKYAEMLNAVKQKLEYLVSLQEK